MRRRGSIVAVPVVDAPTTNAEVSTASWQVPSENGMVIFEPAGRNVDATEPERPVRFRELPVWLPPLTVGLVAVVCCASTARS